jgi:hypothetical protein
VENKPGRQADRQDAEPETNLMRNWGKHWISTKVPGTLGGKWICSMLTYKSPEEQ